MSYYNAAFVLALASVLTTAAISPLPGLNIDPASVTISGISSGADFVVNLHVAHSSVIKGLGVFAGQAYHCAVTRFPKDPLVPASTSVPVCDGCPKGQTLGYDHCKQHPEFVDVDMLVEYAKNQVIRLFCCTRPSISSRQSSHVLL